jgi:hypothetical protein
MLILFPAPTNGSSTSIHNSVRVSIALNDRNSSVNQQILPTDKPSAQQIFDRLSDILRHTSPFSEVSAIRPPPPRENNSPIRHMRRHIIPLDPPLPTILIRLLILMRRFNPPRTHTVDPNPKLLHTHRHRARQANQPSFRRRIAFLVGIADNPAEAAHEDDAGTHAADVGVGEFALVFGGADAHVWDHGLGEREVACQVHIDVRLPLVDGGGVGHCGVVVPGERQRGIRVAFCDLR